MNPLVPLVFLMCNQNNSMTQNKDSQETVEVIIECATFEQWEDMINKFGIVKHKLPMINSYVIEVPVKNMGVLNQIKEIKSVHQNTHITAQMNVARKIVKADIANNLGYTGSNVTIAILDTGIAPISDFCTPKNRIIAFRDFINENPYPYDDNGHGTHVKSIYPLHFLLKTMAILTFKIAMKPLLNLFAGFF